MSSQEDLQKGVVNFGTGNQSGDVNIGNVSGGDMVNIFVNLSTQTAEENGKIASQNKEIFATGEKATRNKLWNIFYTYFGKMPGTRLRGNRMYIGDTSSLLRKLWVDCFSQAITEYPGDEDLMENLYNYFAKGNMDEIVEFFRISNQMCFDFVIRNEAANAFNRLSEQENFKYRYINDEIVKIE